LFDFSTLFGFFTLLSLFYVGIGLRCLYRVATRWRDLWDDDVTRSDLSLAREASFYLLVPPTVALHELGHAALIWAQGGHVSGVRFYGYMGAVFSPSLGAIGDFAVALAGNAVTLAIGVASLMIGLRRAGHPVRNVLWIDLGRQSLFLVLVFYPALCIAFAGDFQTIYNFGRTPIASSMVALAHAAILTFGYGVLWKKHWRPRAFLLSSPAALPLVRAESRLKANPDDLSAARVLGLLYGAAQDHVRAKPHLMRVIASGHADAKVRAAHGVALAGTGEHARAVEELTAALDVMLRPEDRLDVEIALARSLLALEKPAEAAARLAPLVGAYPQNRALIELYERTR
jgi:hypothetical protein